MIWSKSWSVLPEKYRCLHILLPDHKVTDIVLRNSGTSFNLPHCSYKLYKQSFANRCLFCDCYWYVLFCGTYMLFDLIWFIFFSPHNWMAFVRLNKRHVILCYVMLSRAQDQMCVILITACAVDRRFSAPNWSLPSLSSMHSKIHASTKVSKNFCQNWCQWNRSQVTAYIFGWMDLRNSNDIIGKFPPNRSIKDCTNRICKERNHYLQ